MTLIHRSVAKWPSQSQRPRGLALIRTRHTTERSSLAVNLGDVKPALNTGNIKGLSFLDNPREPRGVKFDFTPMREAFCDELRQMKVDPQRLSERAVRRITALMRQSDLRGDTKTAGETTAALAA